MLRIAARIFIAVSITLGAAQATLAEKRVALVIGNSAYANASALANPVRDARAVAQALRAAGFSEVTEGYDLNKARFDAALKRFGDLAAGADWALIYYAGHGVAVGGETFLLPVDVALVRAEHVDDEAISLARVRAKAGGATALRLVILDSCRNNPFTKRMWSDGGKRAVSRGLARPPEVGGGELIAYATRENETAEDGVGSDHSPFTTAFLQHVREPGLEVGFLFRKIRASVMRSTAGSQDPATYGSLSDTQLFFSPPAPVQSQSSDEMARLSEKLMRLEEALKAREGRPSDEALRERVARLEAELEKRQAPQEAKPAGKQTAAVPPPKSTAETAAVFRRAQVKIAGSSTVFPYSKIVAENFAKANPTIKAPVVETGGTDRGFGLFCSGVGEDKIDIVNSSRRIAKSEQVACAKNDVTDIVEVKFGYDGIVFASDVKGPSFALEPRDVFLALAPEIPVNDWLATNPYKTLKQVNPNFPDWEIVAFIPGEKHRTREVFEEKVLLAGCRAAGAYTLLEEKLTAEGAADPSCAAEKACVRVRKDDSGRHAIDIDVDYTETLARMQAVKQCIGVFDLSFYENNTDKLKVATMSGVRPSDETIAAGKYPVSRPLFFYVKKAHVGVVPGLKEYAEFFVSEKFIGEDGPLAQYGLVPLPDKEAKESCEAVKYLKTMGPLSQEATNMALPAR